MLKSSEDDVLFEGKKGEDHFVDDNSIEEDKNI